MYEFGHWIEFCSQDSNKLYGRSPMYHHQQQQQKLTRHQCYPREEQEDETEKDTAPLGGYFVILSLSLSLFSNKQQQKQTYTRTRHITPLHTNAGTMAMVFEHYDRHHHHRYLLLLAPPIRLVCPRLSQKQW